MTTSAARGIRGLQRGLSRWLSFGPPADSYTAEEVKTRLRLDPAADPRTAAVHEAAARTADWTNLLDKQAEQDIGRAALRLPTIVFWYSRGTSADEIGRRLTPFGGDWNGERAVEAACALIAQTLNRRR